MSYEERKRQLESHLANWVNITQRAQLLHDRMYLAVYAAFDFVKSFALVTKHPGFREEREWRAIYVPERDPLGYHKPYLDYFVGARGVEPKLKFKLGVTNRPQGNMVGEPVITNAPTDILEFVLLGPTVSSPLSKAAFIRMLERNNKPQFRDRVFTSTIPLRPQS